MDSMRIFECSFIELFPDSDFGKMLISMSESVVGSPNVTLSACDECM